ncbi:MAG: YdaU family protein [Patescibacteria group bacterium]|nr:YdaU family protein [Patescibacteria group bacterium]
MGEVYHPPAFQFYPDDFVAGTADFTAEEVGAYMLLMCSAWAQGGIPRDTKKLAIIARVSATKFKRIWFAIGPKFEPHPDNQTRWVQPRMEKVRAEAKARRDRSAENGRRGGRPTETQPVSTGIPNDNPESNLNESSPISYLQLEPKGSGETPIGVPRKSRKEPSETDLRAWRILDAAWDHLSGHHEMGDTVKFWKQKNKADALDLVELNRSPEDVVEMLEIAFGSEFYSGITTLRKLKEHWPRLVALDEQANDPRELRRRAARGEFLPDR